MVPDTMQLGPLRQVSLPASDVGRAVAFYRDLLGLPLVAAFGDTLAFFDLDGTRLMIEGAGGPDGEAVPTASVLYFWVADIRAAYDELLARGVPMVDEPHVIHRDDAGTFGPAGEEEWMAFFRDSEGNTLALASRRAPAAD
jgi:catechol 2,3-dioxygenase-like lactoylglutathione lyase family enzyme